eukprot:g502.t1
MSVEATAPPVSLSNAQPDSLDDAPPGVLTATNKVTASKPIENNGIVNDTTDGPPGDHGTKLAIPTEKQAKNGTVNDTTDGPPGEHGTKLAIPTEKQAKNGTVNDTTDGPPGEIKQEAPVHSDTLEFPKIEAAKSVVETNSEAVSVPGVVFSETAEPEAAPNSVQASKTRPVQIQVGPVLIKSVQATRKALLINSVQATRKALMFLKKPSVQDKTPQKRSLYHSPPQQSQSVPPIVAEEKVEKTSPKVNQFPTIPKHKSSMSTDEMQTTSFTALFGKEGDGHVYGFMRTPPHDHKKKISIQTRKAQSLRYLNKSKVFENRNNNEEGDTQIRFVGKVKNLNNNNEMGRANTQIRYVEKLKNLKDPSIFKEGGEWYQHDEVNNDRDWRSPKAEKLRQLQKEKEKSCEKFDSWDEDIKSIEI